MKYEILKDKNFSLLMLGKLVSFLGSNIQQFALSLYVLAITGSATIFASVLAITVIPRLILSPVAGVFADWFDRKKIIVLFDLLNGILIGFFAIVYFINGELSLLMIYVLVIVLEITEIFFAPAMTTVIPSIIDKEKLLQANSIDTFIVNFGNLFVPIIAAALYGLWGMQIVLLVNSISFIISAVSEMFIVIPKNHKKPEKINLSNFKTDFIEGIKSIKESKIILTIIGLGIMVNFCVNPLFNIGIIYIIKEVLACSDFLYGIYQTVLAISMVTAPIICLKVSNKFKTGKLNVLCFSAVSLIICILGVICTDSFLNIFDSNLPVFIFIISLCFLIGIIITIANIALGTLFNKIVPIEKMGRTSTVFNLGITIATPIGQLFFGAMFDLIPTSITVVMAGAIIFIAVMLFKKSLLNADKENDYVEEIEKDEIVNDNFDINSTEVSDL